MLNVTFEQLGRWRSELADYPGVVRSLNEIEDCDGDVQDAAINLALHAGMEPDNNDAWLLSLALPIAIAAKTSGLEDLCRGVKLVPEGDAS